MKYAPFLLINVYFFYRTIPNQRPRCELPPYYSNPTLLPRRRGWTLPTIIALPNESNIAKNYAKFGDTSPENALPQQINSVGRTSPRDDKRWCFTTFSRDRRHSNRRSTLLTKIATRGEGAPGLPVQHVILQIVLPAQQRST